MRPCHSARSPSPSPRCLPGNRRVSGEVAAPSTEAARSTWRQAVIARDSAPSAEMAEFPRRYGGGGSLARTLTDTARRPGRQKGVGRCGPGASSGMGDPGRPRSSEKIRQDSWRYGASGPTSCSFQRSQGVGFGAAPPPRGPLERPGEPRLPYRRREAAGGGPQGQLRRNECCRILDINGGPFRSAARPTRRST